MKFYIVEDDMSVVRILSNIIEDNDLGTVCGFSLGAEQSLADITSLKPDIVLIDLLMPDRDGIATVKMLKQKDCRSRFIMISQVSAKSMISKAYSAGIDFFISKPVNVIEVVAVIRAVSEKITYKTTLDNIKNIFMLSPQQDEARSEDDTSEKLKSIRYIISKLGMSGEKGSRDILSICSYLIDNQKSMSGCSIKELCKLLDQNPTAMEQRIRRAIGKGLTNLSNMGIEDYMNETFVSYSNTLFNFENVRAQMDFIRGRKKYGGKINMKLFIEGLLILSDEM